MNVATSAELVTPLGVGNALPDAALTVPLLDMNGKSLAFQDIIKEKPAILIVYRGSW